MTVEDQGGVLLGEDADQDRFPVGMRVLAVDDDPICLKLLDTLLRKCQYRVTTTNQAVMALTMLRDNRNKFDLVISDVNMPDMDGFKLLEHVGLEMDLPVIMLSAHSDTELVMKGVTHGACDYLLKPVRIEELKNIWQHVIRRKKIDSKDQINSLTEDKTYHGNGDGGQRVTSTGDADQSSRLDKKRKEQNEDEEEDDEDNEPENEDASTQKKPRVVWSVELHRKFVVAVNQLGLEKAVPKKILDLMNVEGLTRENVASHLQKYRLYLRRINGVPTQQVSMVAALGGKDSSYLRMGSLDEFGEFRTLTESGKFSSSALSSYPPGGILSRINSPANLTLHGITTSELMQPSGQNLSSSINNNLGKLERTLLSQNQSANLFQGIPTSFELNQLEQSNCTTRIGDFNPIKESTGFPVATSYSDSRITAGSSTILSSATSNHLVLHGNPQPTHNMGAFRNQSSLGVASVFPDSFDISSGGSSIYLDHNLSNESWQSPVQLSRYSSNALPLIPALLDNSQGDAQCQQGSIGNVVQKLNYISDRRWEEQKQGYNQSSNHTVSPINSLVDGIVGHLSQSVDQNNAMCSRSFDVSMIAQVNNGTLSSGQHSEFQKSALDRRMKSSADYLLEHPKTRDGFVQNGIESLDDIRNTMMKRELNQMMVGDGEFEFDAYSLGSCI